METYPSVASRPLRGWELVAAAGPASFPQGGFAVIVCVLLLSDLTADGLGPICPYPPPPHPPVR